MTTDVLIEAGRPDKSCARACYVDWQYSSAFVVSIPILLTKIVRCSIPHRIFSFAITHVKKKNHHINWVNKQQRIAGSACSL